MKPVVTTVVLLVHFVCATGSGELDNKSSLHQDFDLRYIGIPVSFPNVTHFSLNLPQNFKKGFIQNVLELVNDQEHNSILSSREFFFTQLKSTLGNQSTPSSLESTDNCASDIWDIVQNLQLNLTSPSFALKFLDAEAKLPSGILNGRWMWLGEYDECMSIGPVRNNLTGQYYQPKYFFADILHNGKQIFGVYPLLMGLCLPSSCTKEDVESIIDSLYYQTRISAVVVEDEPEPYTTGAKVAFVISGLLSLLVIIGTSLDLLERFQASLTEKPLEVLNGDLGKITEHDGILYATDYDRTGLLSDPINYSKPTLTRVKDLVLKIFKCFSFVTNTEKLLSTSTAEGPLACLNGLRVVSMWWVIQGHTYSFVIYFIDNSAEAVKIVQRFDFQPIMNGTFSVDTFFFLSGLLVAYLGLTALRTMKENGTGTPKNMVYFWVHYFVHRYWRLTPLYGFVLMIYTTLMWHMIRGPFRLFNKLNPQSENSINICEKYWWSNLIYINNFYPENGNLLGCMGWSWYLANDMQFYIVLGPLFLVLTHLWKKVGVSVAVALIAICVVIRGLIAYEYGIIGPMGAPTKHMEEPSAKAGPLYQRPYTRMGVYLVGMLVGHILCSTRCRIRINRMLNLLGWAVAIATALAVIYGLYGYYHNNENMAKLDMSLSTSVIYIAFSRVAWSLCLGWVVLSCATGHGGPVNTILSWKVWAPLGRLTYAAYLIHIIVIYVFFGNMTKVFHFSDLIMVQMFISCLVLSYGVSYIVSMVVEAPMMQLEKLVTKGRNK